uniref:2-hydroxyacyl-CoA lyase 2 n=1 Tax=Timema monikensis TaxID=170555 RepID=A0A7R9DWV0_9NEOP|nr:unnamed protein product [Timema monikensis]
MVDENSNKHGGELVAEILKSHGVNFLFTLVGGHISPILVGAEKLGIKVVDTRHEVNAVFAADAVARLSGTVGVAVVTAGPGVTNTVTAVKNAKLAESPILLIGGAAAGMLKGRGALQDIDQISLFTSICKYCTTIKTVREIVPTLKLALQIAASGTPGKLFKFELHSWYLNNYVNNIFAGAWEPRDTTPLKPLIALPDTTEIQKCVQLVSCAKRPIILVGSQAILPPNHPDVTKRRLESIGIPCFLGGMARGILGKNSPLHIRHERSRALKEADLVILAGTSCDFRLSYGRVLPRKAVIIAVNRDKIQLYMNSDIFWKPSVAIQGDVGSFIQELSLNLTGYKCNDDWLEKLKETERLKEEAIFKMSEQPSPDYHNPLKVLYELEKILPDNAILVADGGDFVGTAANILRPRGPLQWLDPGPFGTLGVGGGFALGAKLCRPDAQVWIVYGDGSCAFSIAEMDTFVRHKLPVLALVGNDAAWTQIAREQVPIFGTSVACNLAYTNYHDVAIGYGAKGVLISSNTEDIAKALTQATHIYAQGNSVLINVLIGKSKFREGSIAV